MVIEKDEFEAWRESPMTEWFMGKLKTQAGEQEALIKEQMFLRAGAPPLEWAADQPGMAKALGFCDALSWVTELKLEDLQDEDDE